MFEVVPFHISYLLPHFELNLALSLVDLHRLLHWRQNIERLPSILTAVVKVPGDEIVKVSV